MAGQWRGVKGLVVAGLIGPGLFGAGLSGLARPAAAQEPIDLGRLEVEVGSRASDRVAVLSRSVTVLDREELSVLPVRTVADALEWAIGVDVQPRSPAQADLSVRGAGFEEVLVLVDGVRVSDAQTGHFNLNLPVPLEQVERIEVLRGPASALYGSDAVGGVVNIVTGTPPVGVRASAGSFGALEISASGGASGEAGRWRAGAEHARADGHRPGTDYAITLARAGGELTGGWGRAGLDVSHGRRAFGASGFYAPYDSFERTRTSLAVARWAPPAVGRRTSAPPLSVQGWVREHHDDFILRRDDPEFYRNRHVSRQYGGSLSARGVALGPVQAGVALEAEREDLASSSLGDHRQDRLAAAAELVSDVGPLLLSGGLRGDWYERFGAELAPSLSLALGSPAWPVRVRGAWGRAYRVPSWTERY
ncbi:MAG: TonB-dependent receptor plug domain-containing protein, partial [Gemmatimonadota bacterium]